MAVRTDKVQVELEIQAAQARAELDNLQRKSKVLGEDLKGLVKGTKEYADAQKELRQVNARMAEIRKELGLTGLSYNQLNTLSNQLNRELRGLAPGTEQFIAKSKELSEVTARLEDVKKQIKGVQDELPPTGGGFVDMLKKGAAIGGIALGAEAIVGGLASAGRAIFDTTAKFEKYEAVLENALGDKSAAQEAMRQIQDLAAKTPFSVDELTASYIKFVNRGIVPSMSEMNKLADVAASQGKTFDQLTEAVLDAGSGEFERLKEFGIQASKSGNEVELSFKGITTTVANTPDAINGALIAFGEMNGVAGTTAKISETLEGQLSNLGDTTDQLENEIGQGLRPAFVLILQAMSGFLGLLRESKGPLSEFINYFISLYNESVVVRGAINLLVVGFQNGFAVIKGVIGFVIDDLVAAGKVVKGVFTLDFDLIKQGYTEAGKALKDRVVQVGQDVGQNLKAGVQRTFSSADKVALLGVSEKDTKAAEDSMKKAAERVGAAAKQKAADQAAAQASLAALKDREANIKAALALATAGSAEELRLKKLEVAAKRDIELADEKKTAAEKKQIRAEATGAIQKLQADYDKKQKDAVDKRSKEELEIEKRTNALKAGLLQDEADRRISQIIASAEQEKKQAKGTAEQIAAQRRLIDQKMYQDIAAEQKKALDKEADVRADIQKRQLQLEKDEYVRRAGELRLAAAQEMRKVQGEDAASAQIRKLIQEKLQQDLLALEKERVDKQEDLARRIVAIDQDIADKRAERARTAARERNPLSEAPDREEEQARKLANERQLQDILANDQLTNNERLAAIRQFHANKEAIEDEFAQRARQREQAQAEFVLTAASSSIQLLADFAKISSDKELARVDKDKTRRLASLEAEHKAGKLSKEDYEKKKTQIEAGASQETRRIKKDAAEADKKAQIAQAVIAGILAVIKAAPNIPLQIATGVLAAASVAKIVATPIPEFEKGGIFNRVKKFATGGFFNSTAGVPDRGQLHSGGGIKMVDGASGQVLGEMERGEPYMILSRTTYANNRHVIDSLLDSSMNRGGAPVKFADGGVFAGSPAAAAPTGGNTGGDAMGQALVQEVRALRSDVRNLHFQVVAIVGDAQVRDITALQNEFAAQEAEATA